MKKGTAIILIIASVYLLFFGIVMTAVSFLPAKAPEVPADMADSAFEDIVDYDVYYIEELYILERYAFQTADEYDDIESGYTDITFRVYSGDQPMDKYDLDSEYYVVLFHDKYGKPHLASLYVNADKDMSSVLNACGNGMYTLEDPLSVSACVGAYYSSTNEALLNRNEIEIGELRESRLSAYSEDCGIPYDGLRLGYRSATKAEFAENEVADTARDRRMFLIFGILLLAGGVLLLRFTIRKRRKAAQ